MAEQNNNNNFNNVISTSLIQLFDNNRVQLRLSGHDTALSIALWIPELDQVTGKVSYPKTSRFSVLISTDRVASLDKMIRDELIPAYEAGKDKSVSIFTNKARNTIFEVKVTGGDFSIVLHTEVDPMTVIPKTSYSFTFQKTGVADSYNPATGEINIVPVEGNFYIFNAVIHNFVALSATKMTAHAYRTGNEYGNTQLFTMIKAIATTVGAPLPQPAYQQSTPAGDGFTNPSGAVTQYNTDAGAVQPSAQMTEVSDLAGLM